jgi:Contractile injection system tube protein
MPSLSKASLQEITADKAATPVGQPLSVQFNPQSLKLELANKIEGGDTKGRQQRQYLGKTSTTLSFDLHFDTADDGTTDTPVSVRTQTAMVERFVLPKGTGNDKQAPPKCRFHWDELIIDGVIESVSIDFEFFASNGTPLRAKMGVSIKEQDSRYELLESGPGANNANGATPPGRPGTGPGSTGAGPTDRSAQALGGESAADFAARMGLDPSAWRGIAAQLGGGASLSLSAGMSIDFSASLSASAGIGVSAGVDLGASVSLDASFGLAGGGVDVSGAASSDTSAGFALSAAGGLGAALASVATARNDAAASDARRAFGSAVPGASGAVPPAAAVPKPAPPAQTRTPVRLSGALPGAGGSPLASAAAPSAPPPPQADPRASSFGFGVPLRPRAATAAPLTLIDPAAPAWLQGPAGASSRTADRVQARRLPRTRCGCK